MLRSRPVTLLFILLMTGTFLLGQYMAVPPLLYPLYALLFSITLFCGCYFIGLQYFLPSVCRARTTEKVIALSFDDGPGANTPVILDILKAKNVEAAFFCIGRHIAGRESILQRCRDEGHLIGNHSFSHHPLFDLFSTSKMRADLEAMTAATFSVTGLRPALFRPPFGVTNPTVAKVVRSGQYISVGWNLRSYDTMKKNPETLKAKIRRGLKPGGIILLHDTAAVTLEALPAMIDDIRSAGYRLERLDKMCKLAPYA